MWGSRAIRGVWIGRLRCSCLNLTIVWIVHFRVVVGFCLASLCPECISCCLIICRRSLTPNAPGVGLWHSGAWLRGVDWLWRRSRYWHRWCRYCSGWSWDCNRLSRNCRRASNCSASNTDLSGIFQVEDVPVVWLSIDTLSSGLGRNFAVIQIEGELQMGEQIHVRWSIRPQSFQSLLICQSLS